MATHTPNLNLYKPDSTDNYEDFLTEFNSNMDKIDGNDGNQNIATAYDDTATYAVGDYVIYDGLLYKCDTAVSTAETFDPTKWTHVLVTDEMGSGGGGSGGHTIIDENDTSMTQRTGLQFTGNVTVTDDAVNNKTIVDIQGGLGGGSMYLNTIYSTEEKMVGYWTDGKPLYQKTIHITSLPSTTGSFVYYAHNISNIETVAHAQGSLNFNNGYFSELPYVTAYGSSLSPQIGFNVSSTSIGIMVGTNRSTVSSDITLQYTKTTDTADPNPQTGGVIYLPTIYSEEEREVGVWTDGKPLYQKTINIGTVNPDNAWHNIPHGVSDIDKIVNVYGISASASGEYNFIPQMRTTTTTGITYHVTATNIRYISNWFASSFVYVTFQYTKTTDTAGSGDWTPSGASAVHYSTNEEVIGTWIDGKPLYQKTLIMPNAITLTTSGAWVATGVGFPNDFGVAISASIVSDYMQGVIGVFANPSTGAISAQNIPRVGNITLPASTPITIQYTKTTD